MELLIVLGLAAAAAALLRSRSSTPTSALPTAGTRTIVVEGRRVVVHVPPGLRRPRVVLYFHGFGANVETLARTLLPALDAAADPAIVVLPQLGPKSEPGSLASPGAMARLLAAAAPRPAQLDVLAHSGGYHAAALAIGAPDLSVASLGLLDALYGELPAIRAFAARPGTRHIVDVYGPTTATLSLQLGADPTFQLDPVARSGPTPFLQARRVVQATAVTHDAVPIAYGAALIDAFR